MKKISIGSMLLGVILLLVFVSRCEKDSIGPTPNSSLTSWSSSQPNNSDASSSVLSHPMVPSRQLPVKLGIAGNLEVLSKSGISSVFPSVITGDVGTSPSSGEANVLQCSEVSGLIYSVDEKGPFHCVRTDYLMLASAVNDMQTAYKDATNRTNPKYLNYREGKIGGVTFTSGLYKWTTGVAIIDNITLSGGPTDVWIFQVAGTLNMNPGIRILLNGGAKAQNIFWQIAGTVTLGPTCHFEGNILGQGGINLQTGASINGRLLGQSGVTLQKSIVTYPSLN